MEDVEYRPKKRKKRSKFVRYLRAFVRHMAELPAQTLLVIGGSIAIVLITVILLVVLLPRGDAQTAKGPESSATPEISGTPTLPPFTPEPTPEPTPTPHPLTGVGTQGTNGWFLQLNVQADIVADIQTRLIELGYMEMPVIDGVAQVTTTYGPATKKAVQMFQAVNEIELDGCVGEATYDLMMSENAKALMLSRGSDPYLFGDMITKLQERLIELGYMTGTPTGKYGDSTLLAVQKFQSANALKPDGIAGRDTLALIYTDAAIGAGSASAAPTTAPATTSPDAGTASAAPTQP